MRHQQEIKHRALWLVAAVVALSVAASQMRADTGTCGGASITLPFTDVPSSSIYFCVVASAYFSGLTDGTSATTYSPTQNVTREAMAEVVSRTLDQSLKRSANRAALDQWWTPATIPGTAKTSVGVRPVAVKSDGGDLWVANYGSGDCVNFGYSNGTVSRVRASDGKLLGTWTLSGIPVNVLVARGRIFVAACVPPSAPYEPPLRWKLYSIDPTQPPGAATLLASDLGTSPSGIAYDGSRIWMSCGQGVSIYRFICIAGDCVATVTGGLTGLSGILYDGSHIWVTQLWDGMLKKLNSDGSLAWSVPVGNSPQHPIFDGTNIWVPNSGSNSVTVVRVKDSLGNPLAQPFVLATLTGNGLDGPVAAAFDGQRILVTNEGGDSVSLWKAMDLTPLGSYQTGSNSQPTGACSDGINFWITLRGTNQLARF